MNKSRQLLPAVLGVGAVLVGIWLSQVAAFSKSGITPKSADLASAERSQRGVDEAASRGSGRTPAGEPLPGAVTFLDAIVIPPTGELEATVPPTTAPPVTAAATAVSEEATTTVVTTTAPPATTTTTTATPKPTVPLRRSTRAANATPTTTTAADADAAPPAAGGSDVWTRLAKCESGMRNDAGAPYYGFFQFSAQTWRGVGGSGLPTDHPYDVQLEFAKKLQARSGWGQWPHCSKVALRG